MGLHDKLDALVLDWESEPDLVVITSPRGEVEVELVEGMIAWISIDDRWAARSPAQTLSETLTQTIRDAQSSARSDLGTVLRVRKELDHLQRQLTDARRSITPGIGGDQWT